MNYGFVVKMITYADPNILTRRRNRPYVNTIVAVSLQDAEEIKTAICNGPQKHKQRTAQVCVRFPHYKGNVTIPVLELGSLGDMINSVMEQATNPGEEFVEVAAE